MGRLSYYLTMKKWLLCIITLLLLLTCASCSKSGYQQTDEQPVSPEQTHIQGPEMITKSETPRVYSESPKKVALDGIVPTRLYIPEAGINAVVEPVYVSDRGQMGVPLSTERVGYLSNGVLPGAVGNAVMDGHVDSYSGPAVFYSLQKLKKGDLVFIKSDNGSKITFSVESVEIFKKSEAPIQRIFGATEEPRLNLITCTGKYSKKKREHEARLVVFTKRI